jgi:hypothetical protein
MSNEQYAVMRIPFRFDAIVVLLRVCASCVTKASSPVRGVLNGLFLVLIFRDFIDSVIVTLESTVRFVCYFLECHALVQYECYLKCEFEALNVI